MDVLNISTFTELPISYRSDHVTNFREVKINNFTEESSLVAPATLH